MSLFVIGDTHLSLSTDKPMDIFGGWKNYMQRLEENWRSVVQPQDTVIIPGDVSWGMSLEQAKEDFLFLHRLPGKKILTCSRATTTTGGPPAQRWRAFWKETGWTA